MKRLIMALTIAAFGLAYTGIAQAAFTQTATASMNVSMTIAASCSASTTAMNFGTGTGATALQSTSTISVTCSQGTPYRVDIDKGAGTAAIPDPSARLMTEVTGNTITYWLYKTNSYLPADVWGDNGATYCVTCATPITGLTGTGTGLTQPITVYGDTSGGALPVAGTYTDTVTVTVNY